MIVKIDRENFKVNIDEFKTVVHPIYNNLKIYSYLGELERIIGFLNDIQQSLGISDCIIVEPTHGGFIPIKCSSFYTSVSIVDCSPSHKENILTNIKEQNIQNIVWESFQDEKYTNHTEKEPREFVVISNYHEVLDYKFIEKYKPLLITSYNPRIIKNGFYVHSLKFSEKLYVYIPNNLFTSFFDSFRYYLNKNIENQLDYDNLINMCIMVKNGGPQFEQMLINNLDIIDTWTILDTGSTDDTIENIKKILVGKKKGSLYQEPFINFRDSRNRLLELAGTKCKYNIMLDDTYSVNGNLRTFLNETRGDQLSDSFSLFIKSDDIEYVSNRILKSYRNLKYIYKIHEVVQEEDNYVVIVPKNDSFIIDYRCDYMENRTNSRNESDLKILYEELEESPDDPRVFFYLAKTYNNMKNYEKCYEYLLKRIDCKKEGFKLELVDATFEAARLANFQLNKTWSECEKLYLKAYDLEPKKPESLYFIGVHYYLENNFDIAFNYLKKAFEIGYPADYQFNVKPIISFRYIPKFLTLLCYQKKEYNLGFQASKLYLENNDLQYG